MGCQSTTIWAELEAWAQTLKPWQRIILSRVVREGELTDQQIGQSYEQFLHENDLADEPDPPVDTPDTITGRPASESRSPIWLKRIGELRAVNALPSSAELTFSPSVTIVYGGNGVGKSGFTRILSNVCFSRMQHPIIPNIYEGGADEQPVASIVIADGTQKETPLAFDGKTEHAELKRIAVFDTAVARTHLVDQSPLGFTPAGFDVFPEMARVYNRMADLLAADIDRRNKENVFPRSFVAPESEISRFVASLSADTNLKELQRSADFGETEVARLEEVQRQIKDLQLKSGVDAIKELEDAKTDIGTLQNRLDQSFTLLGEDKRVDYRAQLSEFEAKARAVAAQGAESFQQDFFNGVGSSQWEKFLSAAHALAQVEDAGYPRNGDHCLLCHRPLDAASIALVRRFWVFLAGNARREAEEASAKLDGSINALKELRLDFFTKDTTVYTHLSRLNPSLAKQVEENLVAMDRERLALVSVLENATGEIVLANFGTVADALKTLVEQIDADVARLKEQKTEDALKSLEAERVVLRHRQVLNQLLPDVEKFVADLVWVKSASGQPKKSLNSRPVTNKGKELFATVIAKNYGQRLAEECAALDCSLPVEFKTEGQDGQTVRSLTMRGGYSPDKILSEGEQRAVALADFLTEVGLNPANAGIVLDDPVTSQDHERKKRIAHRLIAEARKRQVAIFTHDLVFLTMLAGAASDEGVEILTHWIEKDAEGKWVA